MPLFALTAVSPAFEKRPDECVSYMGMARQGRQLVLQFINDCNENRYIRVCMEQSMSRLRSVTSFQRVQPGGIFSAYALPDHSVRSATWDSAEELEELDPPCAP
jgi:hypothetical protein